METECLFFIATKLKGRALDSIYCKKFTSINESIRHSNNRFVPERTHSYYTEEINNLRMLQNKKVGDFYDKINILLDGARNCLRKVDPDHVEHMMHLLLNCVIDTFIKGLPVNIAKAVDRSKPTNLDVAYREAVRVEVRIDSTILPDTRCE